MSKIIITEIGNIDPESKKKLRGSGYTIIEAKDTSKVKIIGDADFASGNDLFMAALKGANYDKYSRDTMVIELWKRLTDAEKINNDPPQPPNS